MFRCSYYSWCTDSSAHSSVCASLKLVPWIKKTECSQGSCCWLHLSRTCKLSIHPFCQPHAAWSVEDYGVPQLASSTTSEPTKLKWKWVICDPDELPKWQNSLVIILLFGRRGVLSRQWRITCLSNAFTQWGMNLYWKQEVEGTFVGNWGKLLKVGGRKHSNIQVNSIFEWLQ